MLILSRKTHRKLWTLFLTADLNGQFRIHDNCPLHPVIPPSSFVMISPEARYTALGSDDDFTG
jgi:hypothetical protein